MSGATWADVKVYLDEEEIDCDLVSRIAIGSQGFGIYRQGSPHTCTLDLLVPWTDDLAHATDIQVVAVVDDYGFSMPSGVYDTGLTWEWCLFKGTIADRQGAGPDLTGQGKISCQFTGTDSDTFNRRAAFNDFAGCGLDDLIEEASTAVGHGGAGKNAFPDNTDLAIDNEDFDQKKAIGALLQPSMAGWGIWATHEWTWDGDPANTDFRWRPSAYIDSADTTYRELVNHEAAWLYGYTDVGRTIADAYKKVVVTGRNFGGATQGSDNTGDGFRSIKIASEFNTNAICDDAASRLIARQTDRRQNQLLGIKANIDNTFFRHYDEYADVTDAAEIAFHLLHSTRLGDEHQWFFPSLDANTWPSFADPIEEPLKELIGWNEYATQLTYCSGRVLEWSPAGGWTVTWQQRNKN